MCFVPICLMLSQTHALMTYLGQNDQVATNTQHYVTLSLPAVILSGLNDSQRKFLCCYKYNFVPMVTNGLNSLIYGFLCYIFVVKWDLGIAGCAYTDVISQLITFMSNLLYTWTIPELRETHVSFGIHYKSLIR